MQETVKYKLRLFTLCICISFILFTGYSNSQAVYTAKAKKTINQEEKLLEKVQELKAD